MKNLFKCQEVMIIQQEIYQIICIIRTIINLSRQTNTVILQQINFSGKLEKDDGTTMSFIVEKQQKTIPNFSLDLLIITEQYE